MSSSVDSRWPAAAVGYAVLVWNIAALLLGLFYVLNPALSGYQHLFGAALLLAWLGNALLIYLNHRYYGELAGALRRLRRLGYFYLGFTVPAFLCMFGAYFVISGAYADALSELMIPYMVLYTSFFGVLLLGAALSGLTLYCGRAGDYIPDSEQPRRFPFLRGLLGVLLYLMLILGIYLLYMLLSKGSRGLLEMLVSQYALYAAFIYLSITLLLVKLKRKGTRSILHYIPAGVGLLLAAAFMLPLLLTPLAVSRAEREFEALFGPGWEWQINPAHRVQMSPVRFSIPAYFLGRPYGGYTLHQDVLYYEGTDGVDEGLRLYYDAYLPPANAGNLPGNNAVLIRIHGGAWTQGSKGGGNMMNMNKYFAAQGYAVFDVQYGLSTNPERDIYLPTPDHVRGSFTVDDMLRHLGIFTYHLAENASRYGIDLERVFVSGGSAGGQLATAMVLTMDSGEYAGMFSPELTVVGLIPFYPANKGHELLLAVGGSEQWLNVETLVAAGNPPALIYQGANDGMVPAGIAFSFQERYLEQGNENCAVLLMPLASHASDLHFTGYYNQVFLYYMERFMYMVLESHL